MVPALFVYIMLIQRERDSERDNWCVLKKGESNLCWDQNVKTIEMLSVFERKRMIMIVYLQLLKEQSCAVVPTIYSHHIMPCHAIYAGIN